MVGMASNIITLIKTFIYTSQIQLYSFQMLYSFQIFDISSRKAPKTGKRCKQLTDVPLERLEYGEALMISG